MTEPVPTSANVTPPPVSLLQMMTGYWVSQAVYVAAKLGIADRLADGPASVDDLATTTHSHARLRDRRQSRQHAPLRQRRLRVRLSAVSAAHRPLASRLHFQ